MIDFLALIKQNCSTKVNLIISISNPRTKEGVIGYQDIVNVARVFNHYKIYEPILVFGTLDSPIRVSLDGRHMAIGMTGGNESARYIHALKELANRYEVGCYFEDHPTDDTFYFIDGNFNVLNSMTRP